MSKKRVEVRTGKKNKYEVICVVPGAGEIVYGKANDKAGLDRILSLLKANPKTKNYPVTRV